MPAVEAHPLDHSYKPVFALCLAVRNMMLEMVEYFKKPLGSCSQLICLIQMYL
jgi:hypothetical protein